MGGVPLPNVGVRQGSLTFLPFGHDKHTAVAPLVMLSER